MEPYLRTKVTKDAMSSTRDPRAPTFRYHGAMDAMLQDLQVLSATKHKIKQRREQLNAVRDSDSEDEHENHKPGTKVVSARRVARSKVAQKKLLPRKSTKHQTSNTSRTVYPVVVSGGRRGIIDATVHFSEAPPSPRLRPPSPPMSKPFPKRVGADSPERPAQDRPRSPKESTFPKTLDDARSQTLHTMDLAVPDGIVKSVARQRRAKTKAGIATGVAVPKGAFHPELQLVAAIKRHGPDATRLLMATPTSDGGSPAPSTAVGANRRHVFASVGNAASGASRPESVRVTRTEPSRAPPKTPGARLGVVALDFAGDSPHVRTKVAAGIMDIDLDDDA